MVFDKPRLPGVQARRENSAQLHIGPREEVPDDARHLGLKPRAHPSAQPEKGIRNARHVDLTPKDPEEPQKDPKGPQGPRVAPVRSRCYPDSRSGTELLAAACPGRRPAA